MAESTVAWLTWRQLVGGRRGFLLAALALAPTLLAVFFRLALAGDAESEVAEAAASFLASLERQIVIGTILPLGAAILGTTAFGGELEDGTLVYLLVKPIERWRLIAVKYATVLAATWALAIVSIVLPWALLGSLVAESRSVGAYVAAGCVAGAVYSAIFLMLGIATRRGLVLSLLYVIGFEGIFSRSFAGAKSLSVREMALSVAHRVGGVGDAASLVTFDTAYTVGSILLAASLIVAAAKLSRHEVAERL